MVGVASTCTPSMDTQKGVRAVLGVVYVKAGVRAVARHVATICAEKPPTTIMERCALARCLDWLDNRMPGAFLHLPIYLQLFYLTRKVGIMEALESNNETALVEALSSRSAAVMAENLAAEGVPVAEDCLSELLAEPGTDEAFDAETDYVERDAEAACRSGAHNVADSAEITVDDIEQALLAEETGNQMETYHWTNPFPDGSEPEEQVPEQAPEPKEEHPIEEKPLSSDLRGLHKGVLFRRLTNHKTALLPFDENIPSHKANVLNYSSVYRIWQRIAQRAGISENITPHSGRVGGAVSLAEDGASLPELQLAGGWQSPEMPGHYTKQANVKRGGMAKLSAKRKR